MPTMKRKHSNLDYFASALTIVFLLLTCALLYFTGK
jgi:hypothetical protein